VVKFFKEISAFPVAMAAATADLSRHLVHRSFNEGETVAVTADASPISAFL
jgi:hypothetical protein